MPKHKHISRWTREQDRSSAWRVKIRVAPNMDAEKTFTDVTFGGTRKALKAAVEWRDQMVRTYKDTMPSLKPSGTVYREPRAKHRHARWVAMVNYTKKGERYCHRRFFSIEKYGELEAELNAIEALPLLREKYKKELANSGS